MSHSIAIIGAGHVGATTAYTLCLNNIASTITLVDIDQVRCKGEILDLNDSVPLANIASITMGDLHTAANADIVIVTAGRAQEPNESRASLINTNKAIIHQIMTDLKPKPDASIIMVTNPVDTLTYYAQQLSNLPPNQVIGSGTFLDTQRLKKVLSSHIGVCPQSITALMLGEHGDSQFPLWSAASVQGLPLSQFGITQQDQNTILKQVKEQVYEIIDCKGATYYGIAACLSSLCKTILFNQQKVVPVSCFIPEVNVCVSLPVVLGRKGVARILTPEFNTREKQEFDHSVKLLQKTAQTLNN